MDGGDGNSGEHLWPAKLHLKVKLPGVASVSKVKLKVFKQAVRVRVKGSYVLCLEMPFPMDTEEEDAMFRTQTSEYQVTLNVLPHVPYDWSPPRVKLPTEELPTHSAPLPAFSTPPEKEALPDEYPQPGTSADRHPTSPNSKPLDPKDFQSHLFPKKLDISLSSSGSLLKGFSHALDSDSSFSTDFSCEVDDNSNWPQIAPVCFKGNGVASNQPTHLDKLNPQFSASSLDKDRDIEDVGFQDNDSGETSESRNLEEDLQCDLESTSDDLVPLESKSERIMSTMTNLNVSTEQHVGIEYQEDNPISKDEMGPSSFEVEPDWTVERGQHSVVVKVQLPKVRRAAEISLWIDSLPELIDLTVTDVYRLNICTETLNMGKFDNNVSAKFKANVLSITLPRCSKLGHQVDD
mmetsp:Transcript_38357/g.53252  ORF Transcript_38357/g.53252 Transcript_38357/m.53252 type:complete len:406 (-) Transcript_38357:187-1404(-)